MYKKKKKLNDPFYVGRPSFYVESKTFPVLFFCIAKKV